MLSPQALRINSMVIFVERPRYYNPPSGEKFRREDGAVSHADFQRWVCNLGFTGIGTSFSSPPTARLYGQPQSIAKFRHSPPRP